MPQLPSVSELINYRSSKSNTPPKVFAPSIDAPVSDKRIGELQSNKSNNPILSTSHPNFPGPHNFSNYRNVPTGYSDLTNTSYISNTVSLSHSLSREEPLAVPFNIVRNNNENPALHSLNYHLMPSAPTAIVPINYVYPTLESRHPPQPKQYSIQREVQLAGRQGFPSTQLVYEYQAYPYLYSTLLHVPYSEPLQQGLEQNDSMQYNKRKIKRRTRTGCLTCRKRRIKCDGRKPSCYNCERSKKVCLGYEDPAKSLKRRKANKEDKNNSDKVTSPELSDNCINSTETESAEKKMLNHQKSENTIL